MAEENQEEQQTKRYTDEDVNQIVQKRLARAKEEAEKEQNTAIEKAKADVIEQAKKEAKMTADQKRDAELEQVKADKDKAEAQLMHINLLSQARAALKESNIDLTDDELELVVGADEDTTGTNIKVVQSMYERQSKSIKDELLKGKTPKGAGNNKVDVTAEQFNQMSSRERAELFKDNPEAFNNIVGGI
ncbi:DUF4355 domain-containing protein [Bombilactobacillus folatiphilus]|uniref:DUF4355 domain-containing protein n=1 Tax=Bombilactobacillus folatiphilus TaxID=2923362 RepID=A0ABY4PAC1_9LACO|nr:DUF4355 domain-containing protein [Bombilactobacillus folatiphilus]UQS82601.1 DUF4355 domain-containing protein [Bombilactobacillus folatiphilus]